jgi:hypothetical protein
MELRGRTDQVIISLHESSFVRYPACHVLSLLSVIPVREKETESATNKCHSVCGHEETGKACKAA